MLTKCLHVHCSTAHLWYTYICILCGLILDNPNKIQFMIFKHFSREPWLVFTQMKLEYNTKKMNYWSYLTKLWFGVQWLFITAIWVFFKIILIVQKKCFLQNKSYDFVYKINVSEKMRWNIFFALYSISPCDCSFQNFTTNIDFIGFYHHINHIKASIWIILHV